MLLYFTTMLLEERFIINSKFVTAINCMDGRVQYPVMEWLRMHYQADFVDMITEPGADKIFCEECEEVVTRVKLKMQISIEKHNSRAIAIVGHHDCAGNCVCKEGHYQHVKQSVQCLRKTYPSIDVLGLYVNEDWQVEVVA